MSLALLVLFFICLIIQVYFYVKVFGKLLSHQSRKQSEGSESISVIIAARNEADNLPSLLNALYSQDYYNYEVIIVNDRSSDNTSLIASSFVSKNDNFHLININSLPEGWNGKKHAIYNGVKQAKNDLLLFIDGDCIPKSNLWIQEMSNEFSGKTEIVLGFSPYHNKPGILNLFIQFETLFTGIQYLSFALWGKPYMGVGRNLGIRRDRYDILLLEKIANTTGGDDDLMVNNMANKFNTSVQFVPNSQVFSIPEDSWVSYFKQKIRHLSVGKYYRKKDRTLLALFTLSFLFGWILFFSLLVSANNPYLILTAFGLRSLSFYTIFARVGQKFDVPVKFWALPFLDLCYSIYYPLMGIIALSVKSIRWK